jgi:hypothetical protein
MIPFVFGGTRLPLFMVPPSTVEYNVILHISLLRDDRVLTLRISVVFTQKRYKG